MTLEGSCHCGGIRIAFRTGKAPAELGARACQCSFCRAHGASWTSDPSGSLEIALAGPVSHYRFGTGTADFRVCGRCGVVPAVTWEAGGRLLGVVRVQCLAARDALLAHERPADFETETAELRLARRARNWTPVTMVAAPG
jgi:hypothetical protein